MLHFVFIPFHRYLSIPFHHFFTPVFIYFLIYISISSFFPCFLLPFWPTSIASWLPLFKTSFHLAYLFYSSILTPFIPFFLPSFWGFSATTEVGLSDMNHILNPQSWLIEVINVLRRVKTIKWSLYQDQNFDGIGVGRIEIVLFSSDSDSVSIAYQLMISENRNIVSGIKIRSEQHFWSLLLEVFTLKRYDGHPWLFTPQ